MGVATRPMRGFVIWLLVAAAVTGCGGGDNETAPSSGGAAAIRIGAFDFPESELLAELYAQALEAEGLPVRRLGRIGSREVVQPALEQGLIDLVPEYAGAMLSFVSLRTNEPTADTSQTVAELRSVLEPRGMVALAPAPAQNRNAIVVTKAFAAMYDVVSVGDLAPLDVSLAFGGPPECPERYFCLEGLGERYGLEFGAFVPTFGADMVAESLKTEVIDVGLLFSTDPVLVDRELIVLTDDRRLQPAENVIPVMRREALERWGAEVAKILDGVSSQLTTVDLVRLNSIAAEPEAELAEVVAQWRAGGLRGETDR